MHLTNINATGIDITMNMFILRVMAVTMTIVIVSVIVSVMALITISNSKMNNNNDTDIVPSAINMITITIMYNTIALTINDTTSSNINIIIKK